MFVRISNMTLRALFFGVFFFCAACFARADAAARETPAEADAVKKAFVVKIDGQIATPQVYILSRAIRAANAAGAELLVLDMDTPGGDLGTTLELMQLLSNFKGKTLCYVNPEAISAGSFIAVACDEIWFAPNGVMGAAEAVTAAGGDVDESMRRKITSYLAAKVRSISGDNSRRAEVQRAMNDPDFELNIGGKILKKPGELLSLTAKEAAEVIDGAPVLSNGTAADVQILVRDVLGEGAEIVYVKSTWADIAAKYVSAVAPLVMGVGFFLIIIDVKNGGFGVLAGIGVAVLLGVFAGTHMSGLSGYEEILIFILGAALVVAELLFFPGMVFPIMIGIVLMLGSLAWALGGIWPAQGFEYNFSGLTRGVFQVFIGVGLSFVLALLFAKFLPKTPLWGRMVLAPTSASLDSRGAAVKVGEAADPYAETLGGVEVKAGSRGVAVGELMPSGQVNINGRIVDAVSVFGHIGAGEKVEVVAKKDFNFLVKKIS